jgi:hypothetical protein
MQVYQYIIQKMNLVEMVKNPILRNKNKQLKKLFKLKS